MSTTKVPNVGVTVQIVIRNHRPIGGVFHVNASHAVVADDRVRDREIVTSQIDQDALIRAEDLQGIQRHSVAFCSWKTLLPVAVLLRFSDAR